MAALTGLKVGSTVQSVDEQPVYTVERVDALGRALSVSFIDWISGNVCLRTSTYGWFSDSDIYIITHPKTNKRKVM